jgi:hypothetical protein
MASRSAWVGLRRRSVSGFKASVVSTSPEHLAGRGQGKATVLCFFTGDDSSLIARETAFQCQPFSAKKVRFCSIDREKSLALILEKRPLGRD